MLYEVEIRFWINNTADVWSKLPFLKQLEWKTEKWHTEMFGIKLFEAGELLRISEIYYETHSRLFLGWKGVDKGKLANIREELGEEITDGITKSLILQTLGLERKSFKTSDNAVTYLSELSMPSFMTFSGENLALQYLS
jgi:adenylate cyclase class IV